MEIDEVFIVLRDLLFADLGFEFKFDKDKNPQFFREDKNTIHIIWPGIREIGIMELDLQSFSKKYKNSIQIYATMQ